MRQDVKNYIENNSELLTDVDKFILTAPSKLWNDLFNVLDYAKLSYENITLIKCSILLAHAQVEQLTDVFEEILINNGANSDDTDPLDGFLKGMSEKQLLDTHREFKELLEKQYKNNYYVDPDVLELFSIS